MEKKERVHWIDVARGIAIICVVFGHASIPDSVTCFIYSFHMPLFFFLSGVVFSAKREFIPFVKHKISTLLLPWVVMSGIEIIFDVCWESLRGNVAGISEAMETVLCRIIGLVVGFRFGSPYIDSFWFIKVIFVCSILAWVMERMIQSTKIKMCLFVAMSFASVMIQSTFFNEMSLPWSLDLIPVAFSFLYGGILYKEFVLSKPYNEIKATKIVVGGGSLLLVIVQVVLTFFNSDQMQIRVGMYDGRLNNPILFLIGAWLGIIMVVNIAKNIIYEHKALEWCGRNTLVLYFAHSMLFAILFQILKVFPFLYGGDFVSMMIRGIVMSVASIMAIYFTVRIDQNKGDLLKKINLANS